MRPIRRIIVHHGANPTTQSTASVRKYHRDVRGWSDIGYHWYLYQIFADGPWTLEAGRPEDIVGSHDQGQNTDSVGICVAGDYSKGPVAFDAWILLVLTCANVCRRYKLTADQVEGHRENEPASTPTACPGFDPAELRAAIALELLQARG